MHCQLLIPGLAPYAGRNRNAGDPETPALDKIVARGTRRSTSPVETDGWLLAQFGVQRQQDWPVAPLTLLADGESAGAAYWLRADPLHFQFQQHRIIVGDAAALGIQPEEATALAESLNRHFADDRLVFHAPAPERWYIRLAHTPDLRTVSTTEAAEQGWDAARPMGRDSAAWRRIGNEIQMLLHAHPINAAREARGEPALNNLWLWGGGVLPGGLHRPFQSIAADDPLARGLALASGIPCSAIPENADRWLAAVKPTDTALAVLTGLIDCRRRQDLPGWRAEIARLEQHWFAPLTRALQRGALRQLTLHAPGARALHHLALRRRDGWKRWRRAAPID